MVKSLEHFHPTSDTNCCELPLVDFSFLGSSATAGFDVSTAREIESRTLMTPNTVFPFNPFIQHTLNNNTRRGSVPRSSVGRE